MEFARPGFAPLQARKQQDAMRSYPVDGAFIREMDGQQLGQRTADGWTTSSLWPSGTQAATQSWEEERNWPNKRKAEPKFSQAYHVIVPTFSVSSFSLLESFISDAPGLLLFCVSTTRLLRPYKMNSR